MDKIYIGDIPSNYHYAIFSNYYIDLYDRPTLTNGTFTFYRIYLYDNQFAYSVGAQTYNQYYTTTATDVEVTDNIRYRRDFPDIVQTIFIYCFLLVFLLNLVTSSIKKGGMLGGLLWLKK